MIRRVGQRFSPIERRDLLKAWIILSLAFAIVYSQGELTNISLILVHFLFSAFTVGVGFLLHELGHKFVAQRYGLWAEFRAYDQGLFLALIMSFFGFVFAAPGAVVILGHTSLSRIGKISIAGPLVNYMLAVLFFVLGLVNPFSAVDLLFSYGAHINAFLGLFNLIPFWMFDGKKIIDWSTWWYGVMVACGFFLTFLTSL